MPIKNKFIFIEKQKHFNDESINLLNDIKNNLNINQLEDLRIIKKYIVSGLDDITFKKAIKYVFSEPQVDNVYIDLIIPKDTIAFATCLLPGQFDQRSDSAEQCIKLLKNIDSVKVISINIYILYGKIGKQDLIKIKKYLINPVDTQEVDPFINELEIINKPNLEEQKELTNFNSFSLNELISFHKKNDLAMSIEDIQLVQTYFKNENRQPTTTEIKVIDTYWSDHCRHTTFETIIDDVNIETCKLSDPIKKTYDMYLKMRKEIHQDREKHISLMDIATICAKFMLKHNLLKDLDISDENNACSININVDIDNKKVKYLLMFKNETHNHPTEIEPFGGASTCLGGAIRDPLSGRTYVYQAMRITGCADPTVDFEQTLKNKLPQKTITLGAAKGYSSYGNQIGIATGFVDEIYHHKYVAKRLEVGAVLGAAPKENVTRQTPEKGDQIILLGGKTGRDGIAGATGSSKIHTNTSIHTLSSQVQKGNPICERKIQRLFMNKNVTKLIKKCNDFGAGGVSVAVGELCNGVDIFLDKIPKKYPFLNATELALSESQERMAIVLDKNNVDKFIKLANEENLEATVIAEVTDTNTLKIFYKNKCVVNLKRDFLNTNGVSQHTKINVKKISNCPFLIKNDINLIEQWEWIANNLNSCSKHGLIQMFDSSIGANTVLAPLGGRYQLTPCEAMVSKIPTFGKTTNTCSLMSYGFDPKIGEWSPFHMGYFSVIEAITKIVVSGGDWKKTRLSCQEYFEKLGNDKNKWGKPFSALLGALKAQCDLSIPSIGGKDSMSGTFEDISVPPTLICFAVSTGNVKQIISPEFKQSQSYVCLITPKYLPDHTIDPKSLINNFEVISNLIQKEQIFSAASLRGNGLAESLFKMCIGNKLGIELDNVTNEELFGINYGSVVLTISPTLDPKELLKGSHFKIIGKTTSNYSINLINKNTIINLNDLEKKYLNRLSSVFKSTYEIENEKIEVQTFFKTMGKKSKKVIPHPQVIIPVFPGTNCEYDMQYAFERAGAKVKQILIRNQTNQELLNSINELAKNINKANIVAIPGGFSSGDEPDGSAKFIVNVFRNDKIKKAITNLLDKREGLMLGICNGFQALVKLGLLPYGKIIEEPTNDMPTLTFNKIQHHMSRIIRTKMISNNSPWTYGLSVGEITNIPISHGEGKFYAQPGIIREMIKNGQIVFQYVDYDAKATMKMPLNPNGSVYAIEGICSPDGRILGKMGHSERIGKNLYKNVFGKYDQQIFESGVKYFTHKK